MKRKDKCWLWIDKNHDNEENTTLLNALHLLNINVNSIGSYDEFTEAINQLQV